MTKAGDNSFNIRWETDVYAQGEQINRYPFPVFIGRFLSHFGRAADRKAVKILEVGSGAGNNLWFFAREGFDTHAIEGAASAVAFARRRLEAEGLSADIRLGDFQRLPFEDASMDFVLDRGSITHNTRPVVEAVLDEIRRVLKPGGMFFSQIFSTRHGDLRFADDFADGSAASFSDGYFANIGRTFFADRADIDKLYGSRFEICSLELESQEDVLDGQLSAVWNVWAGKRVRKSGSKGF
jgi:SAM-dependent methyltransferase